MSGTTTSAALWGRYLSLIVADAAGNGREMVVQDSHGQALHVVFSVKHICTSSPHTLVARIYNVNNDTANFIADAEGTSQQSWEAPFANRQIVLKAGYLGNYGMLFSGQVRQVKIGRENQTDTFVEISAADSDSVRNWALVNKTISAGHSQQDVVTNVVKDMAPYNTTLGTNVTFPPKGETWLPVKPPAQSPRGRALYGPAKNILDDIAAGHLNTWSLDNNKLNFLARTAYAPGDAVVLTARTGLIGMPQLTRDGISIRCLLNPAIGYGTRVKIDNASVQYPSINLSIAASGTQNFPPMNADGDYKVLWVDHIGDNRGSNWYSDMICLSIDPSAGVPTSVRDIPSSTPG